MKQIVFDINSHEEIWSLIDKKFDHIFIHKFMPNEAIAWWKTDVKMKNGEFYENLNVRNMEFDILTDLNGLEKILVFNSYHLRIYQFDKVVPDKLSLEYLPPNKLEQILLRNGLKHTYFCDFEFLTISSSDEKFIEAIENNTVFKERIEERRKM
ncbi:hypothetical protein [Moheibacter sediminis]|nr:hypothetical protein [Moheibacter sediminis]